MKVPLMSIVSLAFSIVILGYISSALRLCRHLEEVAYDHMSACSLSQISEQIGNALAKELCKKNISELIYNATLLKEVLEQDVHAFEVKADKSLGSFGIGVDASILEISYEEDTIELMLNIFLTDNRRGVSFLRNVKISFFKDGN